MGVNTDTGFTDYRYVRNKHARGVRALTLRFEVDQENDTFTFSWAICLPEDNFSREEGRAAVNKRWESGTRITGQYLRQFPLQMNARLQIQSLLTSKVFPEHLDKAELKRVEQTFEEVENHFCW